MWVSLLVVTVLSMQALALEWPNAYVTSGLIYMPYGEISEPFTAYINEATGQGRIDYFGGKYSTCVFSWKFMTICREYCIC